LGRRISKTITSGTPTQFLYDGNNAVQETVGSTVNPILVGLGIDERYARNDVTGRAYFLSDALNSTIALTSSTGAIQNQYSYDPYGNVTASNATFTNPDQYTGREADAPGLYYYRARYYSPPMGGFISEDPIGFGGGQLSFYAYVGGSPLNMIDPLGLSGIYINYPDYPITIPGTSTQVALGHAAVVAIDDNTGTTQYFEYGRYDSDFGNARQEPVPNVQIGDDGLPTQASLANLLNFVSKHYGHGGPVDAQYYQDADYQKIVDFARNRIRDKNRDAYSWNPLHMNTCKTFAHDAISAGLGK
jgi:RHS repeat-associated protein